MKLGSQLSIKQSQNLSMTQSLQQAIRILQLSQLELELEINQQLDANIMLEADDYDESLVQDDAAFDHATAVTPEHGADHSDSLTSTTANQEERALDLDRVENIEVELDWESAEDSGLVAYDYDEEPVDFLNQRSEAHDQTLHEFLYEQLLVTNMSPQDRLIAEYIIDSITPEGYFFIALSEVVAWVHDAYPEVEEAEVAAVLTLIQQFDPPGVASCSLQACLIKQIMIKKPVPAWAATAIAILTEDAELLAKLDLKRLQNKYQLTEAMLRSILNELRFLTPNPGSALGSTEVTAIKPDILVAQEKGQIKVSLNSEVLPKLRINRKYARLAQLAKQEERVMLRDHLTTARFFLKHIEDRFDTLLKVATAIVEHQKLFFLEGASAMRSLQLKQIAEELGYNESTISRAVSGKYLMCAAGVFELKYFFANEVEAGGEDSVSSVAIRAALQQLIDSENPEKPYSDAKLVTLLEKKGFTIARRTVAKYRDVLGVLSSTERKRLA